MHGIPFCSHRSLTGSLSYLKARSASTEAHRWEEAIHFTRCRSRQRAESSSELSRHICLLLLRQEEISHRILSLLVGKVQESGKNSSTGRF